MRLSLKLTISVSVSRPFFLSAKMLVTIVSTPPGSAHPGQENQRRAGRMFIQKMLEQRHQKLSPYPGSISEARQGVQGFLEKEIIAIRRKRRTMSFSTGEQLAPTSEAAKVRRKKRQSETRLFAWLSRH